MARRHRGNFVPHHPRQPEEEVERAIFDWTEFRVQEVFRRADPLNEDVEKELSELLMKKASQLTPPMEELKVHRDHYDRVFNLLHGMCRNEYDEMGMQDVIMIGSFLKGTECIGHLDGEIVVAFSNLPNMDSISKIVERLVSLYNKSPVKSDPPSQPPPARGEGGDMEQSTTVGSGEDNMDQSEDDAVQEDTIYFTDLCTYSVNIVHRQSGRTIVIRSTAPVAIIRRANDINPTYLKPFEETLAAIRHAGWFQQHVTGPKLAIVRDFTKIINDMKNRVPGLNHLTSWHVELLCQCASLPLDGGECLPYTTTFRRLFQLVSAGLFLPGVLSIIDPCEEDKHTGIQMDYTPSQQDEITRAAQYLLRLLYHREFERLLGIGQDEIQDTSSDLQLQTVRLRGTLPVVSS